MVFVTSAISLGGTVLATLGATTSSLAVLAGIGFATQFALGAALQALTPKPAFSGASRGYQVNSRGSALDHQIIYGRVRVGGAIVYDESTGDSNKYLHRVIAVAGHRVDAFENFYINDEVVTLDTDGFVVTPEQYAGKVRIKSHVGTDTQAADSDLVSESDKWTSQHRLRGIAYIYVRLEFNADSFPNGVPTFTTTVRGKRVFNPDNGLTLWSDNPALCIRDYLTSKYGLNESTENIDDGLISNALGVCNQTNTGSGSTRYTCNGAFTTDLSPYDVLSNLLTSLGGTLWYSQGKWRLKPSYWTTPVADFNEDDLRSSINVVTRHSRRDNFNAVQGTFRGLESNWQTTDYPKVDSPAFLAADGGQESIADVDLPFTDNSIEARRLGRIALERNRQQLTVTASFGISAMRVQVGDNITLSNKRFGWVNKEFEVLSWSFGLTDGLDLQVNLTLRETAESVFDEVDDGAAYERDNTNLPSAFSGLQINNLTATDSGALQEDGGFVSAVSVDWDSVENSFVSYYEIEWKTSSDSRFYHASSVESSTVISPVIVGQTYSISVRAVSLLGNKGAKTTISHTAGGDTTAPSRPTSVNAQGAFRYITVSWINPPQSDFSHVNVYEANSNSSSSASLIASIAGDSYIRPNLGLEQTKWYFLKSVDYSGNESNFTSGVSATTTFLDDPDFENGIYSLFTEQNLYAIRDVSSLPASGAFVGEKVFNRDDGKLYQWTGSDWELVVADVANGSITETKIADDSVTTPKLVANAVTGDIIAGNTITGNNIVGNTITGGLLATSGIITNSAQINDAVVTNAKIDNLAVSTLKIEDQAVSNTSFDTGSLNVPSNGEWNEVVDVTFTSESGNRVLVWVTGTAEFSGNDIGGPATNRLRVRRNGSTLQNFGDVIVGADSTDDEVVVPAMVVPTRSTSGSTTISVDCRKNPIATNVDTTLNLTLIVTELKK